MSPTILHFLQDPSFWVAFVTLVFVVLVFKPARSIIVKMLDSKIIQIKNELEEANRLKDDANNLLAEAERKFAKSEEEAKEILSHANKEAKNIITNTKEKLAKDIESRKKIAVQKIKSAEESAIADIKKNISNIVVASAQTILEENVDDEAFQNIIDDSLEKVSKTIH